MNYDPSLWSFIENAGIVVKLVMLLLLIASITSWTMIFQRGIYLKTEKKSLKDFNRIFWSGKNLNDLYEELKKSDVKLGGMKNIFISGFEEFKRLRRDAVSPKAIMEGTERVMRVSLSFEAEKLEKNLSFLATVGSTSPYVGLFGTVWGIMTSFQALGHAQQATISMVAPGISEALIATAIGLFAAIPAVIAYNRYSNMADGLLNQYETFQDEFSSILHRYAHSNNTSF